MAITITNPSLIICLGGTGKNLGLNLKARLLEENEDSIPEGIRFLAFDTDPGLEDVTWLDRKGQRQRVEFESGEIVKGWEFDANKWLSDGKEADRMHATHFFDAFDDHLQPGFINDGAGQIRQIGRLCFFQAITEFITKAQDSLDAINGIAERLKDAIQQGKLPEGQVSPNVFILSSTGGGTGSGCFIDTAYITRQLATPGTSVQMVLFLAETLRQYEKQGFKFYHETNSYAALQELEYFNNVDKYEFLYPSTPKPFKVEQTGFPADATLLVSKYTHAKKEVGDFDQIVKMTVNMMYYYLTGAFSEGTYLSNIKKRTSFRTNYNGRSRRYLSFGISRVKIPREELSHIGGIQLFQRASNAILMRNVDAEAEAQAFIDNLGLNELDNDDLINRIVTDISPGEVGTFARGRDWSLENDSLIQHVNDVLSKISEEARSRKVAAVVQRDEILAHALNELHKAASDFDINLQWGLEGRGAWCRQLAEKCDKLAEHLQKEVNSPGPNKLSMIEDHGRLKVKGAHSLSELKKLVMEYREGQRNFVKRTIASLLPRFFKTIEPSESKEPVFGIISTKLAYYELQLDIARRTAARDIFLYLRDRFNELSRRLEYLCKEINTQNKHLSTEKANIQGDLKRMDLFLEINPIAKGKLKEALDCLLPSDIKPFLQKINNDVDLFADADPDIGRFVEALVAACGEAVRAKIQDLDLDTLFKELKDADGRPLVDSLDVLRRAALAGKALWPLDHNSAINLQNQAPPYCNLIVAKAKDNAFVDAIDRMGAVEKPEVFEHPVSDEGVWVTYEHSAPLWMLAPLTDYASSLATYGEQNNLVWVYVMGRDVTLNLVPIEKKGEERRIRDLMGLALGLVMGFVEKNDANYYFAVTGEDFKRDLRSVGQAVEYYARTGEETDKEKDRRRIGRMIQDDPAEVLRAFLLDPERTEFIMQAVDEEIGKGGVEQFGPRIHKLWKELRSPVLREALEAFSADRLGKEIHKFGGAG